MITNVCWLRASSFPCSNLAPETNALPSPTRSAAHLPAPPHRSRAGASGPRRGPPVSRCRWAFVASPADFMRFPLRRGGREGGVKPEAHGVGQGQHDSAAQSFVGTRWTTDTRYPGASPRASRALPSAGTTAVLPAKHFEPHQLADHQFKRASGLRLGRGLAQQR